MGGCISRMAKQELLATIRDRYRESSRGTPSPPLSLSSTAAFLDFWCSTAMDRTARTPNVRWTNGVPMVSAAAERDDDRTTGKENL